MANEAPERIWIWPDTIDEMGSSVNRNEINGYVEYVRADKLEELAAENERLEKNLRTVQNAAKTLASAQGTELEHRRRNADYDHKLRAEHESLIERDAIMTDALLKAEVALIAERADHAKTKSRLSEALGALAMLPEPGESVMLLDDDRIYVRVGELRSARRVLLSIVPNHPTTHNP